MENFKHVFGPVPSRRMGLSIGISPVEEGHCNYSCIYCQLGRTRKMRNEIENYFDINEIIGEFKEYIKSDIDHDVVTIVGEGEPLLYSEIGELIKEVKKLTDKPVAVITNGALLVNEKCRKGLLNADIVLPSLDATNEEIFKKVNRPHGKIKYDEVINALIDFSKEFKGELWIETMIMKDINDNKEFYLDLKEILEKINYHRIYINSPVRPPAEGFVKEPSKESIDEAIHILNGISIDKISSKGFSSEVKDDYEAVLNIIKRHPMNQFEIGAFLDSRENKDKDSFFERLNNDENIEIVNYKNYYTYRLR